MTGPGQTSSTNVVPLGRHGRTVEGSPTDRMPTPVAPEPSGSELRQRSDAASPMPDANSAAKDTWDAAKTLASRIGILAGIAATRAKVGGRAWTARAIAGLREWHGHSIRRDRAASAKSLPAPRRPRTPLLRRALRALTV